jgi:hypothetical protein
VRTVLGLSKTSTSSGWVLVDGRDVTGEPLDHDAFDVTEASADPVATARRAREIATATGYTIDCVRVTSSDHSGTDIQSLRKALAESGFSEVVPVPLAEATQAWAMGVGLTDGFAKTAVCIVDRKSASLSVIDTATGAMTTQTASSSDSATLIDWLPTALGQNGSYPEALFLVGARCQLDAIAGRLGAGLSIPVVATPDAQVILARGAAFSNRLYVNDVAAQRRAWFPSHALPLAGVSAVAIAALLTLSSASGPIHLADRTVQQEAVPPAPLAAESPASAAPVALPVLPPPPAAPILEPPPAAFNAVLPEVIPPPVVEAVPDPPPVQHLPEAQALQYLPEAQPVGVPALAPAAADPLPTIPASVPPPPAPDPIGQLLFGALP